MNCGPKQQVWKWSVRASRKHSSLWIWTVLVAAAHAIALLSPLREMNVTQVQGLGLKQGISSIRIRVHQSSLARKKFLRDYSSTAQRKNPKHQTREVLQSDDLSQHSSGVTSSLSFTSMSNPTPHYPLIARRRGIEGRVRIRLFVDSQGITRAVELIESSGHQILDHAALKAARKWTFRPVLIPSNKNELTPIAKTIRFRLSNS